MKRLSVLLLLLSASVSFGMMQDSLKNRLDQLSLSLVALGHALAPAPVAPTPVKVKDPLKQLIKQFLGSLTPEQRAEFENFSAEERAARLAQIFAQGGQAKTAEPVPPAPSGPTPTLSPEPQEPGFVIPDAPVAPDVGIPVAPPFTGAPIAPPPPGVKIGDIKPVAPKAVKPLLPVLSAQELASKTSEEMRQSDALFLEFLTDFSSLEFEKLATLETTLKQMLTAIRADETFLKRSQLDAVLDKESGLLATFAKEFYVDGNNRARLIELYGAFAQVKASSVSLLFKGFLPLLAGCLFDPSAIQDAQLELMCVTYVVAQRGAQPAKGTVSRESQDLSDAPYIAVWKTLTHVENGIADIARRLNFVRMHPDFLLYQNMLWRGKEGSPEFNTQKSNPLKGTLPLLLLLKYPQEFKVVYGVVETTIKSHMFDVGVFESTINAQLAKQAFEWQREHSVPRVTRTLQEYVLAQLKQIKSLASLKTMLTDALAKYPADTAGMQGGIQQALAQLDPANPKIESALIVGPLQELIKQPLPQDIQTTLQALVTASIKDRALVGAAREALKTPQQFNEALIAALEKQGNTALGQQIALKLTDLYRTPRDVYDLIVAQLNDKKSLTDKQSEIIAVVKPYGILLSAFRYFVDQYKRNPENVDVLKQNLGMLMKSLNVIANPTVQLSTGKAAAEEIAGRLPALRTQLSNGNPLFGLPYAPELFDVQINDALIGKEKAGYYTGQLAKYDLYKGKKLQELLGYIKQEKNPAKAVAFLTDLVSQAKGVSVESSEFKQLMIDVQTALQGTYDKGIKPEYIE